MIVDFEYKNTNEGAIVEIAAATLDAGKTWTTIDHVVELMETCKEEFIYIAHLDVVFRFFEPIMIRRGWINKYCKDKGNGWKPYAPKLKPLNYTVQLWGKERICSSLSFCNINGNKVKVLNASKWIKGASIGCYKLTEEDYAFLSQLKPIKNTPASSAIEKIGKFYRGPIKNFDIFYDLKTAVEGGLIKLYVDKGTFVKKAYHYDITSLYPSVLCSIEKFPDITFACYTTEQEIADHEHYAYWTYNADNSLKCDVISELIPAGSIKMPLYKNNNLVENVKKMFEIKQHLAKGTVEYNEIKIELNSFIGMFIRKNSFNDFYPYASNDTDCIRCTTTLKHTQLYEIYEYIIALAKKRVIDEMKKAIAQGAAILQVNTDGFFTDKPIKYDAEKFLGSLRFEYEAHNLTLFACNQYSCDEETCIAGLPLEYYAPDKTEFEYKIMTFDKKKNAFVFSTKKITLGEEVIYER